MARGVALPEAVNCRGSEASVTLAWNAVIHFQVQPGDYVAEEEERQGRVRGERRPHPQPALPPDKGLSQLPLLPECPPPPESHLKLWKAKLGLVPPTPLFFVLGN